MTEKNHNKIRRMRTINETLKLIKSADPSTAITYYTLRKMCESKIFTVIKLGKKILLNLDELAEMLNIGEL